MMRKHYAPHLLPPLRHNLASPASSLPGCLLLVDDDTHTHTHQPNPTQARELLHKGKGDQLFSSLLFLLLPFSPLARRKICGQEGRSELDLMTLSGHVRVYLSGETNSVTGAKHIIVHRQKAINR